MYLLVKFVTYSLTWYYLCKQTTFMLNEEDTSRRLKLFWYCLARLLLLSMNLLLTC